MSSYIDSAIQTSPADMDTVLLDMQKVSGSLGEFLQELFRHPSRGNKDKGSVRSQKHSQMVVKFLQGRSKVKAEEIVDLIYNHPEAVPKTARSNASRLRRLRSRGLPLIDKAMRDLPLCTAGS